MRVQQGQRQHNTKNTEARLNRRGDKNETDTVGKTERQHDNNTRYSRVIQRTTLTYTNGDFFHLHESPSLVAHHGTRRTIRAVFAKITLLATSTFAPAAAARAWGSRRTLITCVTMQSLSPINAFDSLDACRS